MLSQRFILAIGLAILLVISATSIGLDTKSRWDAIETDRTVTVLKQLSDLTAQIRTAESAARGFVLTGDPGLAEEFQHARDTVTADIAALLDTVRDPAQRQLLEETSALVRRRRALGEEMIRLRSENEGAAAGKLVAEARGMGQTIAANLAKLQAEQRERRERQTAVSRITGRILLAVDLCGVALILLLAGVLMREVGRTRRHLSDSLDASRATTQSLEASVAERTEHLVAAHEELRRSSSVMESTFHSMAEAVLVIDRDGEVLLSNPAAEKMLRYRPGMNVIELRAISAQFHADGVTPLTGEDLPASRALRGEEFDNVEFVARSKGGKRQVHLVVSGRPWRDAAGAISGATLVYHDITASRETERKLQQAQKLEAIGKLTGGVAHDFNNMLTVITGTTETLVTGLSDRPALRATATLIDQAAQRCAELIESLLAFARRQPLHPRNVDVNAAIADVAKLLRPTLGEQIEIETALDPNLASAHLDASQLANALLNMAINARDAMPSGGRLKLQTRMVSPEESGLDSEPAASPPRYVMIAVSDTGTGMPASVRERVFEPFFTTKQVGEGSGLGLSMVYGFVTQSGGHIRIDSEEGVGTTIRLYLPPAEGEVEKAVARPAPAAGGSETILVVEDDALVRNFVTAQLTGLGYTAVATADGPAALEKLKNGERFDLLFTDVVMPGGISGRQLADEAEKIRPGLKVLYTSGYTDDTIMHHGRLDPGVLLLQKPYRKGELARMVRQALGN
ncbi:MAG: response regulator [Bradyrhizobium sp.]|nr:response regulator [Bradyrhizobium sp.]